MSDLKLCCSEHAFENASMKVKVLKTTMYASNTLEMINNLSTENFKHNAETTKGTIIVAL